MCNLLRTKTACSATAHRIARQLYSSAHEANVFGARRLEGIIGACVVEACRRSREPKLFADVAHGAGVAQHIVGRDHTTLMAYINRRTATDKGYRASDVVEGPDEPMAASRIRSEFSRSLKLSEPVVSVAVRISQRTHGDSGSKPANIAAVAVLFAAAVAREPKSLLEVAAVMGTTEGSLRKGYGAFEGLKWAGQAGTGGRSCRGT